jgi:hypothetical protein
MLQKKVPALAEAFDTVRMKPALQEALFSPAETRYSIVECSAGKALYLPDQIINMQYTLKILDTTEDQSFTALVNARLFTDIQECKNYLENALLPLAAAMAGRPEITPFQHPASMIASLAMALSVFPIDGLIPTLVDATDPGKIAGILAASLPEAISGEFTVNDVHLALAHYGRYKRCVLRYSIDGIQTATKTPQTMTVYGKVNPDGLGGLTVSVLSALEEKLRQPGVPYRFRIPRSYGYFPDLKLILMESLPGKPFFKDLLKTWRNDENGNGKILYGNVFTLEGAIKICALIASTLHGLDIQLGPHNPLELQVTKLQEEAEGLCQVLPEVGAQIKSWIGQTMEFAQAYPAMPARFSHGDFTYTQLIFDGKAGGLVDFDTICQAEPAQDLGHYLAYQRLNIIKDQDVNFPYSPASIDRLCDLFLDTYIKLSTRWIADEELLRARVSVYELISLIRLTLHSWEKMKGSRLKQTITLLEERIAWQKQNT